MRCVRVRKAWRTAAPLAVAAVVGLATPAAAAEPSSTTVQANPSSVTTGASVTLNGEVSCAADPSRDEGVTFWDGSEILATVPVASDGSASYTTQFDSEGAHTITAAYNGNSNCDASNGTTTVQVSSRPAPPSEGDLTVISLRDLYHNEVYSPTTNVNGSPNAEVNSAVNRDGDQSR